MKLRAALIAALLVPSAIALTGPAGPAYAVAVCQGQPATIEGTGTLTGTDGNDVIVATGLDAYVDAKGGNDLICLEGGRVDGGTGDDSVVSTAPAGVYTESALHGGSDSYTNTGEGVSRVYAYEVTGLRIALGPGGGNVWLYSTPTSTPGTGSVDLGPRGGRLFVIGDQSAQVDLAHGTASVDNLLKLTIANVPSVFAIGYEVRIAGDEHKNRLDGVGCDLVMKGGDGPDKLTISGYWSEHSGSPCPKRDFQSVLMGQGGADRLNGRGDDDVLLGGRGRDVAGGSFGRDRCVAEVERRCEW